MQHATFALTAILVASQYTTNPQTMLSVETLVLSLVMLAPTFVVHTMFYGHGQTNYNHVGEHARIQKRSLWILAATAGIVISDQVANTSENETWIIAFLFLAGMAIWELFFYMISEEPSLESLRKNKPRKSH